MEADHEHEKTACGTYSFGDSSDLLRENLDLFGFELTDDEMAEIGELDRGEKHDWY